jgi:hypothetical protein
MLNKQTLRRLKAKKTYRIRVFQISGIALFTLSVLNALFLKSIPQHINMLLLAAGAVQFILSFVIWQQLRRYTRRYFRASA